MIYDLPIQIYPSFIHWSYFGSRATFATVCGSGTRCRGVDDSASCEILDFGVDRLEAPDLRLGSGLGSLRGSPVCAGARPGPGLWTQCPHNPHHCPPTLERASQGRGERHADGWGQYSSRVSGEPIVVQMATQPCPPELSNFGSGTELFTGNHVYLECRGAEISGNAFQKYKWKMLSNARVCLSCSPHSGYISSPSVACLVFTWGEGGLVWADDNLPTSPAYLSQCQIKVLIFVG